MTENMKKFLEQVSANEELAKKVNSADRETLVAMAAEMGIQFTDADLENKGELSDDELDMVAGGASVDCFCLFGGGGTGDSNDNTCACVVAGFGFPKNSIIDRCVCAVTGFGKDT